MLTARNVELNVSSDIGNAGHNKVHPAPDGTRDRAASLGAEIETPIQSPIKKLTFSDATVPDTIKAVPPGGQSIKGWGTGGHTFVSKAPLQHPEDTIDGSSSYGLPDLDDEDSKPKHWWEHIPIIMPHDPRYMIWWYLTMAVSLVTAALDPYRLAFVDSAGLYPYTDGWAVLEYCAVIIFLVDMTSKFCLAYTDPEVGLETRHKLIATHYLKFMFWVDLLATFPIDGVVAASLGLYTRTDTLSLWIGCVRWLRLARLYRIFDFFQMLEHKMVVSQVTLILLRNNLYIAYITHWVACLFYWVATMEQFQGSPSWVGRSADRLDGQSAGIRYLYALYFSVGAFAGLGDNDFFCASPAESVIMIIYLLFNIVLQAYILGTITMVMVKGDEKSRVFRDRIEALRRFSKVNDLPDSLATAMKEHIELQFLRDQASDEQVLQDYPATLRRKALRHLYAHCLTTCPLLRGTRGRFLDQLLVVCRPEIFMPHVSLLQEGDVVSELMLIVEGNAQGVPAGQQPDMARMRRASADVLMEMHKSFAVTGANARRRSLTINTSGTPNMPGMPRSSTSEQLGIMSNHFNPKGQPFQSRVSINSQTSGHLPTGSRSGRRDSGLFSTSMHSEHMHNSRSSTVHGGLDLGGEPLKTYGPSDCIGAVPFFTDTSSTESVYTTEMTRVLIISKSTFDSLNTTYPQQVRVLLENLRDMAEEDFIQELEEASLTTGVDSEEAERLKCAISSGQSFSLSGTASAAMDDKIDFQRLAGSLLPHQRARLEQLDALRKTVNDFCRKQKALRVYEFLLAAATGDLESMRSLMQQGVKPSSCDYDRRTALMVAAHEGQDAVVRFLLSYYVPLGAKDAYGNTALSEAVLQGHDHVMKLLLDAGAPLGMEPLEGFGAICRTIIEGDMQGLRRLLQAGASPSWSGYDGRSGLHVAASEGNLQAVQVLIELGQADPCSKDKWGCTPLEDAEEAGHIPVVDYLTPLVQEAEGTGVQKRGLSWSAQPPELNPFTVQQGPDVDERDFRPPELSRFEKARSIKSYASTASTKPRRRPPQRGMSTASLASLSPHKSGNYRWNDSLQPPSDFTHDDEDRPHNSNQTGRARRMSVRTSVEGPERSGVSAATSRDSVPTSVVLSPQASQATTTASRRQVARRTSNMVPEMVLMEAPDSARNTPGGSPMFGGTASAVPSPKGIRQLDARSSLASIVDAAADQEASVLGPLFVQPTSSEGLALRTSQTHLVAGSPKQPQPPLPVPVPDPTAEAPSFNPFTPKQKLPPPVPPLNLSQIQPSGQGVDGAAPVTIPQLPFPSLSARMHFEDGPDVLRIASLDPSKDRVPASILRQPVILENNSSFSAKLPALDHIPQPQPQPALATRSNLLPRTLDPLDKSPLARSSNDLLIDGSRQASQEQSRLVGNVTRAALPDLNETGQAEAGPSVENPQSPGSTD